MKRDEIALLYRKKTFKKDSTKPVQEELKELKQLVTQLEDRIKKIERSLRL